MKKLEYQVKFLTPAFLGNAEQSGQWRTPPFKALLRQWWRVAWVEANDYSRDVDRLRREEGELFGAAADGRGNRSLVRLRLDRWDGGKMDRWQNDPSVFHREVGNNGADVGAHLYLGYGPLNYNNGTFLGKKKGKGFKPLAAIQSGESGELRIAFPSDQEKLLDRALDLLNAYGALGGRSRNGWGSFVLDGGANQGTPPLRDWCDCHDRNWPHAIGNDEKGALIWQTKTFDDWQSLMRYLAEIKIGLRTQKAFELRLDRQAGDREKPRDQIDHGAPQNRHWLSYPVTHHDVTPWNRESKKRKLGNRLPNSLRIKVRTDEEGKLHGVIFHVPCLPPQQFQPHPKVIEGVWQQVHAYLDARPDLKRTDK